MGRVFKQYYEGPQIYCCIDCKTHLALHEQIISKSFHGRGGKAYLFNSAINVTQGPLEKRMLITGQWPKTQTQKCRCRVLATDARCCALFLLLQECTLLLTYTASTAKGSWAGAMKRLMSQGKNTKKVSASFGLKQNFVILHSLLRDIMCSY
jgi:hypothetical protein